MIFVMLGWIMLLGALLLLPALLFVGFWMCKQQKTACIASLLCAVAMVACAAWLAFYPICRCPEELQMHMTEARWQEILSVTGPVYNEHLPFFPAVITVERADETELFWRVDWFPVGTSRKGLTQDGYTSVHGIVPGA